MLQGVPAAGATPEFVAARAFDLMDLAGAGVRYACEPPSGNATPTDADAVAWDALPTPAWAERALACLHEVDPGGAETVPPAEAAHASAVRLTMLNADQRHAGRRDLARRTTERTLALGRLLVARDPRAAYAQMALGEGYLQAYKNAWDPEDPVAIRHKLKRSIDALHQALFLDPGNPEAQRNAQHRAGRLKEREAEASAAAETSATRPARGATEAPPPRPR